MTTRPGLWPLLIAVATALAIPVTCLAAPTTDVTYCGQSYRGHGRLIGNLDCTGFNGHGVIIERGRLELNGFTISNARLFGVHCLTTCQIFGPGTITDNGLDGVRTEGWVAARDVRITNNRLDGIDARNSSTSSRVVVTDSTITGNGFDGIESDSSVIVRRSTITGNAENGVDVGVPQCDTTGRLVLYRSTVTGNALGCLSGVCADLSSCGRNQREPKIKKSICNTSYVQQSGVPGQTWGVCSQD